ncbi:redoxin family protein [Anatilimnocola floriformis]|uniref:redoxin family protein n=1 Tax=Anatilimnocola floriformis TaxID=2948575 RepID=UPI0020C4637D|nr:redoxin family protein [Anatilimnocola floriformis]
MLASRRWLAFGSLLLICLLTGPAFAGKYNKALSVGDAAPEFKGLEDADGKTYSLADYKDKDVVVVVFSCNTCPTAVDYEDRIIALTTKFADKAAVVMINSNKVEGDLLPQLGEKAKAKKFNFPFVHDDDAQSTAKAYGATFTPEFFVLNKERKVVYMGAFDDKTKAGEVTAHYVADGIAAALAGKEPAVTETVARGCTVRYVRQRTKNSK